MTHSLIMPDAALSVRRQDDQATRLRDLVRSAERDRATRQRKSVSAQSVPVPNGSNHDQSGAKRATVLAIASGKGGVGKTNVSVNLSCMLASKGSDVILLDGDLGIADADVLCGVNTTAHLGHVIRGERELDDILTTTQYGFRLLAGGSGLSGLDALSSQTYSRLVQHASMLQRSCDMLVLDCGAGIGRNVLTMMGASDHSMVVTVPEPTAIADAYAIIKCSVLQQRQQGLEPNISLIVNQAAAAKDAIRAHQRIAAVCARFLQFPLPLAGIIRSDEAVRYAVVARRPFVVRSPDSPAARDVCDLYGFLRERELIRSPRTGHRHNGVSRFVRTLLGTRARA